MRLLSNLLKSMLPLALYALPLVASPAVAGPALVFDVRSGEVLHAHNAFAKWYPASITKLMTAYVAFRAVRAGNIRMSSTITVSKRAAAQPPSKVGFPVGTKVRLEYALQILMVKSANDIAVTVAEGVAGSESAFIGRMNAATRRLGMRDTNFANPHGLPDNRQVTTARDMGLLARALWREFPEYRQMYRIQALKVGKRTYRNHNGLIGRYEGANGMKTGFICNSGFNVVASATRNGRTLIAIVLGSDSAKNRTEIAAGLFEAGFRQASKGLFSRRKTKLSELRRPGRIAQPVVMRPYVCGPRKRRAKMPPTLASFGTMTQPALGDPVSDPTGRSVNMLVASPMALPDRAVDAQPIVVRTTRPSAPLPRPDPRRAPQS